MAELKKESKKEPAPYSHEGKKARAEKIAKEKAKK